MSRFPISPLAVLALIVCLFAASPLFTQEPDVETDIETSLDVDDREQALARAADYMARQALEGHIAFDTDEIKAETGVDVELIEEQVLQQAVLDRLAELRNELPDPDDGELAGQENLVPLDSFEQFVEAFDAHQDVPRIVLLLSPT